MTFAHHAHIPLGGIAFIKAGWSIKTLHGTKARVAPRSDLAIKHETHVVVGVVDFGFVGEVGRILFNLGADVFGVNLGDRIAQLVLEKAI